MTSKAMALLIFSLAISSAVPNANAINVRAATSCGQWVSEKGTWEGAGSNRWLLGFLSGLAAGGGKDILRGVDNESIYLWVDNYCRANPLRGIDEAGWELYSTLVKQKRL